MDLVSDPALLLGESGEQYVALFKGMVNSLRPMDYADYLWLWRYTDATWELIRTRRIRARHLNRLMKDTGERRARNTGEKVDGYEVLASMFHETETNKLEYLDARELRLHELEIERLERAALSAAPALAPDDEHEPAE